GSQCNDRTESAAARQGAGGLVRTFADVAAGPDAQDRIGRFVEAADAAMARIHHEQDRHAPRVALLPVRAAGSGGPRAAKPAGRGIWLPALLLLLLRLPRAVRQLPWLAGT